MSQFVDLTDTAVELLDLDTQGNELYDYISHRLQDISGARIVALSTIEGDTVTVSTIRSLAGMANRMKEATAILGMSPDKYQLEVQQDTYDFLASGDLIAFDSLYELALRAIPKTICKLIETLFQFGDIYQIGFTRQGQVFGGASLLFKKGQYLQNKEETIRFVRQATIALQNKRAEDQLRESEERYRTIFENAMIGLYRTNKEGRLLLANQAFCEIFGYDSLAEMQALPVQELYVNGTERDSFVRRIEKDGSIDHVESLGLSKTGKTVHFLESARKITPPTGAPPYYEGVVTDITQLKLLNHQLSKIAEVQSHDIRGPLSRIMGLINLLEEPHTPEEQRVYIQMLKVAGQSLDKTIHEVVGYTSPDPDSEK